MSRRIVIVLVPVSFVVITLSVVTGLWVYETLLRKESPPRPVVPVHVDPGGKLPTQEEFDALAKSDPVKMPLAGEWRHADAGQDPLAKFDPVKMLSVCLTRYEREVRGGMRCTIEMQEQAKGTPPQTGDPPVQVIDVCVRGDVPDADTKKTAIEVVMKWRSGAKRVVGAEVRGTLFSEKPEPDGLGDRFVTWRPTAFLKVSPPLPPNHESARKESRYCIRDAGLYRTMLRTHTAWKARQDAGELDYEYLGTEVVEKAGGRECHKIRRTCRGTETDAFELGGEAPTDPKVIAAEGFTEVVLYIDRERWLQVGSEVYRTEPDGTKVMVGTYFFRDVDLKPAFADDTFTREGLKK